jgi:hypothetical protein
VIGWSHLFNCLYVGKCFGCSLGRGSATLRSIAVSRAIVRPALNTEKHTYSSILLRRIGKIENGLSLLELTLYDRLKRTELGRGLALERLPTI